MKQSSKKPARRGRDANGVPPVVGLGDGTITRDGRYEAPPFPESGNEDEFKGVTRAKLIWVILATREHAQDQAIAHAAQLALVVGQRDAAAANLVASQRWLDECTVQLEYKCVELAGLRADRELLRGELSDLRATIYAKPTLRARIKGWLNRIAKFPPTKFGLVLLLAIGLTQIGAAQISVGAPFSWFTEWAKICGVDRNEQCKAGGVLQIGRAHV